MFSSGIKDNNTKYNIVGSSLEIEDVINYYNTQKASYLPDFQVSYNYGRIATEVTYIIVELGDIAVKTYDYYLRITSECRNSKDNSNMNKAYAVLEEFNLLMRTSLKLKVLLCYYQEALYGPEKKIIEKMFTPKEMGYDYDEIPLEIYEEMRKLRVSDVADIENLISS